MYAEKIDHTCEKTWSEVDQEMSMQEAFWTSPEMEAEPCRRFKIKSRAEILSMELQWPSARCHWQGESGVSWQKLDERWQAAFKDPILKAIRIYFGHDALEGPEGQVHRPKAYPELSLVVTSKGGRDISEAELKARLILGGPQGPRHGPICHAGTYGRSPGAQPDQFG